MRFRRLRGGRCGRKTCDGWRNGQDAFLGSGAEIPLRATSHTRRVRTGRDCRLARKKSIWQGRRVHWPWGERLRNFPHKHSRCAEMHRPARRYFRRSDRRSLPSWAQVLYLRLPDGASEKTAESHSVWPCSQHNRQLWALAARRQPDTAIGRDKVDQGRIPNLGHVQCHPIGRVF